MLKSEDSIKRTILLVVLTLLTAAMTNGLILMEWAERMEFGARRTAVLKTIGLLHQFRPTSLMASAQDDLRRRFLELQTVPANHRNGSRQRYTIVINNYGSAPSSIRAVGGVRPNHRQAMNGTGTHTPNQPIQGHAILGREGTEQLLGFMTRAWFYQRTKTPMKATKSHGNHHLSKSRPPRGQMIKPVTTIHHSSAIDAKIVVQSNSGTTPSTEDRDHPAANPSSTDRDRKPNVLIVGDSLMGGVGPRLKRLLRKEHGFPSPRLKWKASTGLSRPDYFDWPKTLNKLLGEKDYEVVVAIFGTNDTQPVSVNRKSYRYGTEAWFEHYRSRVTRVLNMLCEAENRAVFWIGLPTMRSESFNEKIVKMNSLYREELARSSCGQYIPMDKILSPDGHFSSYLKVGKKRKKVRAGDGIHLSYTGYDYVARHVINTILSTTKIGPQDTMSSNEDSVPHL